jgi:hypothetical protein
MNCNKREFVMENAGTHKIGLALAWTVFVTPIPFLAAGLAFAEPPSAAAERNTLDLASCAHPRAIERHVEGRSGEG